MRPILCLAALAISLHASAQWNLASDNYTTGRLAIGVSVPTQKLDVRDGAIQVTNTPGVAGYTFIARSGYPGTNESYFYHLISTNFHILGSSKNGTSGVVRKLGFATGPTDSENDIRMTIDNTGNIGIGTLFPGSQLHLASDATHALTLTRKDGTYGFRILRNATLGSFQFQVATGLNIWETKIKFGEGEGSSTKLMLNPDGGNVLIGKSTQVGAYRLDVSGKVHANEVVVDTEGADFVFDENYSLRKLEEVEKFINENNHLPGIASAREMQENGMGLSEMNTKLLMKVEELTLYMIELKKAVEAVQLENQKLKQQMASQTSGTPVK